MSIIVQYIVSISLFIAIPVGVQYLVTRLIARRGALAGGEPTTAVQAIND